MKWMGILVILIIIAIAGFGLYEFVGSSETFINGSATSTAVSSPEIIPGVASVLYTNSEFGFVISRPQNSEVQNENFDGYLPVTQTPVAGIVLPASLFAGTNLGEAGVYIGISAAAPAANACLIPSMDVGEKAAGSAQLGGTTFSIFTSTGVGAGNIYDLTAYRTMHNGSCYELVELLHSGNIANYTPGQVIEFDHAKFHAILEKIVTSFAFSSDTQSGVQGVVKINCPSGSSDPSCSPHVLTVAAYQGQNVVSSIDTAVDGSFRGILAPGQYELRVENASSTRCTSVGVVVPLNSFIATNLSCEPIAR